jgi:murein L,D-transpeptidase YcbB/YkuD
VPAARFAAGKSHRAVPALRQRLAATGELDTAATASEVYDDQLRDAVRRFQYRHGLADDGIAGASTIAAMNVSVERRIRQVVVNLDRWRAMPDVLGARHLLVNIPAFHLYIREDGRPVKDIRVVVGKRGNETPVFSDEMETVVFSPYWNIPDTIVEGETAPAILRDPDYIRRNGLEILRQSPTGLTRVSADDVDWEDPEELRRLAIRQRPGPSNALGHVKFLFPNEYAVYLHDTPSDQLFERPGRAFSHGCVRVEEPQALAEYVLGGLPDWTPERIAEAMHSGTEKHVKLTEPLPVHLVYFTVWPDENGGLRFHGDVYGHDGTHATALRLG